MIAERRLQFESSGNLFDAVHCSVPDAWDGTCLMLPGSGDQDSDVRIGPNRFMKQLAEGLGVLGVSTLRMGKQPLQGVHSIPEGYEDEYVRPIESLLAEARGSGVCTDRIVVLGHSLGAHVAPEVGNRVAGTSGLILLNGHASSLGDVILWQAARTDAASRAQLVPLLQKLGEMRDCSLDKVQDPGDRYLWRCLRYDPREFLERVRVPVLCVACGRDGQIPGSEFDELVRAMVNVGVDVTARFYPELNHLCMPTDDDSPMSVMVPGRISEALIGEIAQWIRTKP